MLTTLRLTQRRVIVGRGVGRAGTGKFVGSPTSSACCLKVKHIQKYRLRNVDFTPAHFDQGDGIDEHWIISSTGKYIIKWNFNKLKKSGIINSYSIRVASAKVVHNEFRYNYNDDILVSETNSVYAQHSNGRKK